MDLVLDGEVLCGQTECVPAHREQHVIALESALSGHDIHSGVGTGVTDVESLSGGVGELYQCVELRSGIVVFSVERLVLVPIFLPLAFNGGKIVTHFFDVLSWGIDDNIFTILYYTIIPLTCQSLCAKKPLSSAIQ